VNSTLNKTVLIEDPPKSSLHSFLSTRPDFEDHIEENNELENLRQENILLQEVVNRLKQTKNDLSISAEDMKDDIRDFQSLMSVRNTFLVVLLIC